MILFGFLLRLSKDQLCGILLALTINSIVIIISLQIAVDIIQNLVVANDYVVEMDIYLYLYSDYNTLTIASE